MDLAHASNETVLGVLKVATQPFIVSHTSLDSRPGADPKVAAMMKPRLISKEHAKAVVGEMLRQGFTASDISKVGGGNFCRVFGTVTAGHA